MIADPNLTTPVPETEPQVARRPVPVWSFILLFILLYWGFVYFDLNGGWFSPVVYTPYRSFADLERWQPAEEHGRARHGFLVYNKPTCVACHQASGMGQPGQFPPLVKSEWVNEPEPGRLIRLVLNGL